MKKKLASKIVIMTLALTSTSLSFAGGGGGQCSAPPDLSSETAVFNAVASIPNAKYDSANLNGLGEDDGAGSVVKTYNITNGLSIAPLGSELVVIKDNYHSFNPDLLANNAISSLSAANALVSDVGASTPQGLYTIPLLKSWIKSLDNQSLYDKVRANKFDGMKVLKRAELSATHQSALASASNSCSHFLAISKGPLKSMKCLNYSVSAVSCESGNTGYVCLQNSIPEKIAADIKIIVESSPNQLPFQEWVNELNALQTSSQASNNTIIQNNMIFYKDSQDKIQCAAEVSSAFAQVTSIANHNSKKYIKVKRDDCADLYRSAAFNPSYDPIALVTVNQTFLNEIAGATGSGGVTPSTTPIADMNLTAQFTAVKDNPVRFSINTYRSIASFTSNKKFTMNPTPIITLPAVLAPPTCAP